MITDPIADMFTRIRNAIYSNRKTVDIPSNKMKKKIADILLQENYIEKFIEIDDNRQGILRIYLKYFKYGRENISAIKGIERVSKPGRRVYVTSKKIPKVRGGFGISILSTSQGILTGNKAKELNIGGELVGIVWWGFYVKNW